LVLGSDPARLIDFTRYFAKQSGVSLPPPRASPEWKRIIDELRRSGPTDAQVIVVLTRFRRVVFATGEVAEPLEEDDAYQTVAEALEVKVPAFRADCVRRFAAASLVNGPNYARSAADLEPVIAKLPGITSVERVGDTFPSTLIAKWTVDGSSPKAPWEAFTEDPASMRWRMGPGEDLMDMWRGYWSSLDADERRAYLSEHAPPEGWRSWLNKSR